MAEKTAIVDISREVTPVIVYCALWTTIAFGLAPQLWTRLPFTAKIYPKLKWAKKCDWNMRTCSVFSSLSATFLAVRNIRHYLQESETLKPSVQGSFPLQLMMGFFILDLMNILVNRAYFRAHFGRKGVIDQSAKLGKIF